jgi:hypothetical protein
MDFIERLFGMVPDGGSGSLELLLLLAPIVGIALMKFGWRRERCRAVSNRS